MCWIFEFKGALCQGQRGAEGIFGTSYRAHGMDLCLPIPYRLPSPNRALVSRFPAIRLCMTLKSEKSVVENVVTANGSTGANDEMLRLLVGSVRDYAIFMLDPQGIVLTWNAGAEALKGYQASEIIGQHFSKFYPEDAIAKNWPAHELSVATAEGRFEDEGWRLRRDGSQFWANVVITAVRDATGALTGFAKVTRDLTERRLLEQEIRGLNASLTRRLEQLTEAKRSVEERTVALRNLSARLMNIQDEERRRVARELHEGLSQELTAMKIILQAALSQHKFDGETTRAVAEGLELAERVSRGLRNLSHLLHPPLLDEAGLLSALPWMAEALSNSTGLEITLQFLPSEFPRLSLEIETAIFRIAQEALANVYHHSDSTKAELKVEKLPGRVCVQIRDYGQGIGSDREKEPTHKTGVGIGGMRERASQLGGELSIRKVDPGTLLEAWLPCD
jgi:PAS domain S-box-containing protein